MTNSIRKTIEENGSITVAQFMEMAMYNSHNGYYVNNNPIGKNADFITAPEISQLFGEMIGLYCADIWVKMGKPFQFNLVELGPGHGTLMKDLLRATKHIEGFHQGCNVHLVDTNQQLIKIQKQTLTPYRIKWHKDISNLPTDLPLIIVANEFFDCLPINQYIRQQQLWYQQSIAIMPKVEELFFIQTPLMPHFREHLSYEHPNSKHGSIIELCYPAIEIIQQISNYFKKTSGCLLAIDYGYDLDPKTRTAYNSTLQSIKNHKFHPIFSDIGRADLTAHVDFFALRQTALANFAKAAHTITQAEFLQNLGIKLRAEILKNNANLAEKEAIDSGLERLISPTQMGNLFKAMQIFSADLI
jgi:NADH dehydrogenase [ubiquinone] 1 alpha subcomplex assembly factor 7